MKPKPFSALNHFTVPCAMVFSLSEQATNPRSVECRRSKVLLQQLIDPVDNGNARGEQLRGRDRTGETTNTKRATASRTNHRPTWFPEPNVSNFNRIRQAATLPWRRPACYT